MCSSIRCTLVPIQKRLHKRLYTKFGCLKVWSLCKLVHRFHSDAQSPAVAFSNFSFSIPRISYTKQLSQLSKERSLEPGLKIHALLTKIGLNQDSNHRNHLISLYSKCRLFAYARKLVDESPEPDLVSWASLLSGFVQNGYGKEALLAFQEMHGLGIRFNEFSFPSVLKACSTTKDIVLGKVVHGIVVITGFERDVFVANTLVVMYTKCGEFRESRRLFDEIPERNVISWNALCSSYIRNDFFEEALGLFQEMAVSGIRPDEFTLSTIINACSGLGDISQGKKIHGYLIKLGFDSDSFSSNALVDMYTKVGSLDDANSVFQEICQPDIISWNSLITGFVLHESHEQALELFSQMMNLGEWPTVYTFSSALKACTGLRHPKFGIRLHSLLLKMNMLDEFVSVALIDMYSKCGLVDNARLVYDLMPQEDLAAINAMISGYRQNGSDRQGLMLFIENYKKGIIFDETTLLAILNCTAGMQSVEACKQAHALSVKSGFQSSAFVVNSLIDAYAKCRQTYDAARIFEECPTVDLPVITSLITAFAQCGQGEEAFKLYVKLQDVDVNPDSYLFSSLLNACANLSAYEQGKQIHVHVLKYGFMSDLFAGNSLVNMYAKCGSLEDADRAFSRLSQKVVVSWSAMIGGLAQHGHGKKALTLFDEMLREGVPPNHVTLVSVLYACNHAGLVTEAKRYFEMIKDSFGFQPTQEHYSCMIDVLGRAGRLDEAKDLVSSMPFEPNAAVWGALLGAARIHKNVELGQHAAEMLLTYHPEKSGTHVLLSNVYASVGSWENVAKMRRLMKETKVKKEPGMSWVEVKGEIHTFTVGDREHSRTKEIYYKLEELSGLMAKAGYVPVIETDLHDVGQKEKELLLAYHSEKLAVAFGLLVTPEGAPIRVKKNLRICVDCHTAFKFICKIVSREIIVRDNNRFHHFRDGCCSCNDYW
ncbi:OLC1v1000046C1 [Oldenlandia corymbosa var. corymbosa]|uniref:OLC1v1000046C1 n=1 Tax=Oldenlandia corymbosa var. corymbosa TaxID=529605 RepID=A0AAV1D5H1_OLDCO|nr:OLC1v1000046C1 [Oldenlandia corymbosa var. corymbosa]